MWQRPRKPVEKPKTDSRCYIIAIWKITVITLRDILDILGISKPVYVVCKKNYLIDDVLEN